eukprot:snap_masked-scaffold_5-processed-gene-9.11-mRNA-1 protein AED:1.00 eAED:1.00 QI:0/0/0/0/1/1/2/0/76
MGVTLEPPGELGNDAGWFRPRSMFGNNRVKVVLSVNGMFGYLGRSWISLDMFSELSSSQRHLMFNEIDSGCQFLPL